MTSVVSSQQSSALSMQPWPLYDLFLDLPHPGASASSPKPFLVPSPITTAITDNEIQAILPQIARFAFPEYDETATTPPSSPTHQQQQSTNSVLNKYDFYAMQNESFKQFAFTLQLQSGQRLHGHVRRYLPPHLIARSRYDVGRRGERALVILTRATGADLLYSAVLKSVEAISSQQAAMSTSGINIHNGAPQKWFLHQLSRYQQHLSTLYNERQSPNDRGKPMVASIPGLELGDDHEVLCTKFKDCDISRFIIPTSLLIRNNVNPGAGSKGSTHSDTAGSILPLLRCIGVAHALRIMAALLSERRVILISSSPTRLAACSHGAISALAVGLLHWQHLYIPVLPPHLWQYLAAPYPYLIGILSNTFPRLERTDGLGEVLIINLDTNLMETRGMDTHTILQRLPDLFQTSADQMPSQLQNARPPSASEDLGRDLLEILREDRKVMYGESTLNRVTEKAAVATKAVKQTFLKLRDKGRQYIQNRIQSGSGYDEPQDPSVEVTSGDPDDGPSEINSMASDYVYTECCYNENAEQECRIAFTIFFLSLIGDMRWYVSTPPGHQVPVLDRNRFLQQRRSMGDGEGTPMWALLNNFCQTQILEEFAKARIDEIRNRITFTPDMPLFLQCTSHCRQHNLDFGLMTCRRIARQIADGSPARLTGLLQTNARRTAMTLTSNKVYEGDYEHAIAQLVEQSRESTSVLFDIMSVIWLRLRDCKGLQWKHGLQALQILRNLLYHGPMAAISEATDGLSKIRVLKYYNNMRAQHAQEIRSSATLVYDLLVDRAKLFHIRRVCLNRRRILQSKTEPKRRREVNAVIGTTFRTVHALMHPNASSGTIVQIPPKAPEKVTIDRGGGPSQGQLPLKSHDFLQPGSQPEATKDPTSQIVDFFDNASISSPASTTAAPRQDVNPFDTFEPGQGPSPHSQATFPPTIAQIPVYSVQQHSPNVTQKGASNIMPQNQHAQQQGQYIQRPVASSQGQAIQTSPQYIGYPGQFVNAGTIPQQHSLTGTNQGQASAHQYPNHGQPFSGPSQPQRPPSMNVSQFDPLARR